MGIEFRESSLTINPKNTMTIQKGMVFSVHVGFAELSNPSAEDAAGKTYALFIGDTVLAGEAGPGVELTAMSKKKISSIAIFMGVCNFNVHALAHVNAFRPLAANVRHTSCPHRMQRLVSIYRVYPPPSSIPPDLEI